MACHCSICDSRRPIGGTKLLVLNGGTFWVEFCKWCESEPITNAETGETLAIGTLYARAAGEPDPGIIPTPSSHFSRTQPEWYEDTEFLEQEPPSAYDLFAEFLEAQSGIIWKRHLWNSNTKNPSRVSTKIGK